VVFDKGRKAGGRTATRCVAGGIQFDHGAGIVRVNWLEPPSDDT